MDHLIRLADGREVVIRLRTYHPWVIVQDGRITGHYRSEQQAVNALARLQARGETAEIRATMVEA